MRIRFTRTGTNEALFDSELLKEFNNDQLLVLHNEIVSELGNRKLKHCNKYLY